MCCLLFFLNTCFSWDEESFPLFYLLRWKIWITQNSTDCRVEFFSRHWEMRDDSWRNGGNCRLLRKASRSSRRNANKFGFCLLVFSFLGKFNWCFYNWAGRGRYCSLPKQSHILFLIMKILPFHIKQKMHDLLCGKKAIVLLNYHHLLQRFTKKLSLNNTITSL